MKFKHCVYTSLRDLYKHYHVNLTNAALLRGHDNYVSIFTIVVIFNFVYDMA